MCTWTRLVAALIAAIATIAGAAVWFEVRGIDHSAAAISWGSTSAPKQIADDMVFVPAGVYAIGDESEEASGDAPLRQVKLAPFRIDRHEVTNRQFAEFVRATSYVTAAEREEPPGSIAVVTPIGPTCAAPTGIIRWVLAAISTAPGITLSFSSPGMTPAR